jgi:hypothetical protein
MACPLIAATARSLLFYQRCNWTDFAPSIRTRPISIFRKPTVRCKWLEISRKPLIIIIDQGIANLEDCETAYSDRLITGAEQSIIWGLLHAVTDWLQRQVSTLDAGHCMVWPNGNKPWAAHESAAAACSYQTVTTRFGLIRGTLHIVTVW